MRHLRTTTTSIIPNIVFLAFALLIISATGCIQGTYGDDIQRDLAGPVVACGEGLTCNGEPCPPCPDLGAVDQTPAADMAGDMVTTDGGTVDQTPAADMAEECLRVDDCAKLMKCQGVVCTCDNNVCKPMPVDGGQVDQTPAVDLLMVDLLPAPSCTDKVMNGDETDVDCGGKCAEKCADGKTCLRAGDCRSGLCSNNVCASSASCADRLLNQDETDVDCGGTKCNKCADGKQCLRGSDCESTLCSNNVCKPAISCSDVVMNGQETDVDCGGMNMCPRCPDNKACLRGSDCASALCSNNVCKAQPQCNDVVKNGNESDVDCGGTCPKCGLDKLCGGNADCVSNICTNGKCAAAPSCSDLLKNQDESDVDCGGMICVKCGNGKKCGGNADCSSNLCSNGICVAQPNCMDNAKNNAETDVDCGGGMCGKCANGKVCAANGDCLSGLCTANVCIVAPTCSDLVKNQGESDVDCGGSTMCSRCANGKACTAGTDCASGSCANNVCVQPQQMPMCNDGAKNGTETDVDCGGMNACNRCSDGKACVTNFDCSSGDCTGGTCRALQVGKQALSFEVSFAPTDNKTVDDASLMEYKPGFQTICSKQVADPGKSLDKLSCNFQYSAGVASLQVNSPINNGQYYLEGNGPNGRESNGALKVTSVEKGLWKVTPIQNAQMTGWNLLVSAPTCNDTALDGFETDVDCGGKGCGPCANGKKCAANSDCASMKCTAGVCQP